MATGPTGTAPPTDALSGAALGSVQDARERVLAPRTVAQATAFLSRAREVCYSGRRFGGKSNLGCMKAFAYAAKYPGARTFIAREERASMEATTLLTLRSEILSPAQWNAWWSESKSVVSLPNGSSIHVFGLDKPGRALGGRYGFGFVDQAEQLSRYQFDVIESCMAQVGMPWHQLLLAFNPEHPAHWAYRRYKPDAGDGPRYRESGAHFADVVHAQPDDLLEFLTPEAREAFDSMEGVTGQRLRWGKWVGREGLVYDLWDPAVHVVNRPAAWLTGFPPAEWDRVVGIDLGYAPNPYCCLWLARDPERRWWIYRQDYRTRLTNDEQAERIRRFEAEECRAEDVPRLNRLANFCDHARGERAALHKGGVPTKPARKDILASIECIRGLLNPRQPGGPRLFLVRGSLVERDGHLADAERPTCLDEEMPRYLNGTTRDGSEVKELPVDKDNHAIAALHYALYSLEGSPRMLAV